MGWFRLAVGAALAPASLGALLAAARVLASFLEKPEGALPFVAGLLGYPAFHLFTLGLLGGRVRQFAYVFGHEFTHALAAWASGHSVLAFSVRSDGGHVDVSRSNAFIALAPYVVPVYALAVVGGYRLWLWAAEPRPGSHKAFLLALGLALGFHLVSTAHALWDAEQPDLRAAGGVVFSMAWIGLGNAVLLLLALKCLFPGRVDLTDALRLAAGFAWQFWAGALNALQTAAVYCIGRSK